MVTEAPLRCDANQVLHCIQCATTRANEETEVIATDLHVEFDSINSQLSCASSTEGADQVVHERHRRVTHFLWRYVGLGALFVTHLLLLALTATAVAARSGLRLVRSCS